MKVENRPIEELIPYKHNQKKHDEKQIQNVANSIRRFGWQQPLVVDKKGVIVIGHCRYLAAQKLGLKEIPVTVADDLTEDEIRELRIADNKTNESPWDFDFLQDDIAELNFDGFEFDFLDTKYSLDCLNEDEIIQTHLQNGETDIDFFNITFSFPKELKSIFEEYIKRNGKKELTEKIISFVGVTNAD